MSTTLHSFIDIFDTAFRDGNDTVQLKKIVIPIIQRDYAQGRLDPEVNRVRKRFLEALYRAVTEQPIVLDFVYGDIDTDGVMTPLDGQQRLTTLFLLHWYAAKKDTVSPEECKCLKNFSYETRYSARYFCTELVDFTPSFDTKISDEIINQAWFPLDWKKDPTINSMLVMIDAINDMFGNVEGLWEKLKGQAITFYFLPIKDMGLTDELYIKMNSRGKPLTMFEHFKAELERELRQIDVKTAERIISKVDLQWTDLLWEYRDGGSSAEEANITDDEFLRYFKFICDVICYQHGESPQGRSNDEFDLLQAYFSAQNPEAIKNIEMLESYFDCWIGINDYKNPSEFLESFMSKVHEEKKIRVDNRYRIDIFKDCLHFNSDRAGKNRQFPLNRFVLLFAIICYLRNRDTVSEKEFVRRIRIVNNLLQNSEDEVSDRIDRNRIPAILAETEAIILRGEIDESVENSYSVNQLEEEGLKIEYLASHPEMDEILFKLEDHPMLNGQISIVGLDNLQYVDRFEELFKCKWDNIDCALMAIGDYGQLERNKWRYQYGSKGIALAWQELFHKSANVGFENTSKILVELLSLNETIDDETLKTIASEYIKKCEEQSEFPWRYYYIKYPEFRPGSYGKLSNLHASATPYLFSVLQTRSQWSPNTYMPFLKVVENMAEGIHLDRDSYGQKLVCGDQYIVCMNSSYELRKTEDDSDIDSLAIQQNEEGIDIQDRIIKLKEYISGLWM